MIRWLFVIMLMTATSCQSQKNVQSDSSSNSHADVSHHGVERLEQSFNGASELLALASAIRLHFCADSALMGDVVIHHPNVTVELDEPRLSQRSEVQTQAGVLVAEQCEASSSTEERHTQETQKQQTTIAEPAATNKLVFLLALAACVIVVYRRLKAAKTRG